MTAGNPQANSIIRQIHRVLADLFRNLEMDKHYVEEDDLWKSILAALVFAVRSTFHTTNKKSPGQLVFGRYIFVPIDHVANWRLLYQR